jgi:cell division protein FtsL
MQGQIVVSKTRLIFIGEPKRKMVNNEQELQDEFDKLSIEESKSRSPKKFLEN